MPNKRANKQPQRARHGIDAARPEKADPRVIARDQEDSQRPMPPSDNPHVHPDHPDPGVNEPAYWHPPEKK